MNTLWNCWDVSQAVTAANPLVRFPPDPSSIYGWLPTKTARQPEGVNSANDCLTRTDLRPRLGSRHLARSLRFLARTLGFPGIGWAAVLAVPMALLDAAPAAEPPAPADPAPGHSWHGEAFDTGPRQQAYLMSGMPRLSFPVTSTNPAVQPFFDQGIGQLHGFWYFEAERTFRRVHQLDTNCAMAFWGMAMANVYNEGRARRFLTNAVALRAGADAREQAYIDGLADFYRTEKDGQKRSNRDRRRDLVRAYEDIVRRFPDDLEAKAFLLYQAWNNSGFGNSTDLPITSHLAFDLLAREVLAQAPWHPVHHYRIHLWDPEQPRQALDSAARCGQGSPGIAHMWHMPGHTYAKLARHDDAAWQQEASARVDHAHMIRDRVLPDQIHNYAHNNDWLAESWSYQGRVREAIDLAKNMVELPRLARTNAQLASSPLAFRYDFGGSSWFEGRTRLVALLADFELWDDVAALADTPYLEPGDTPEEKARRARLLALAHFHRDRPGDAEEQLTVVSNALESLRDERRGAVDFAERQARDERKPAAEITQAMTRALERFNGRVEGLEIIAAELRAYLAAADADTNALRRELELARDLPKKDLALLHWRAGDTNRALTLVAEAASKATNQFLPAALHADLLWQAGQTNEARVAIESLRQLRIQPDLDLPVALRLRPLAQALGLPDDWRVSHLPRADVGERPELDTLGPRHWRPSPAPDWKLTDLDGRSRSLSEYRGRPVVVIFYLGRACPHCLEQLNTFAPAQARFAAAGLDLVAISTDSVEGLKRTQQKGSGSRFPFPLLADPTLETFKAWHVYDDFESLALHGTFLVDAGGLVRWQDISYEPFMDVDFLLAESARLLRFPSGPAVAQASDRQ